MSTDNTSDTEYIPSTPYIPQWLTKFLLDNFEDLDVHKVDRTIGEVVEAPYEFINTTNQILPSIFGTAYRLATAKKDLSSSAILMQAARSAKHTENPNLLDLLFAAGGKYEGMEFNSHIPKLDPEYYFLLDRETQDKELKKAGYIESQDTDYGLVKKAVGNNKYPIYQRQPDAITRSQLIPIGNGYNDYYGPMGTELAHPGDYPTTTYIDKYGNFYQKGWDLNDYGGNYGGFVSKNKLSNLLDKYGTPAVFVTGFQPLVDFNNSWVSIDDYSSIFENEHMNNNPSADEIFWNFIEPELSKVPDYDEIMKKYYNTLPEVVVYPNKKSKKLIKRKK